MAVVSGNHFVASCAQRKHRFELLWQSPVLNIRKDEKFSETKLQKGSSIFPLNSRRVSDGVPPGFPTGFRDLFPSIFSRFFALPSISFGFLSGFRTNRIVFRNAAALPRPSSAHTTYLPPVRETLRHRDAKISHTHRKDARASSAAQLARHSRQHTHSGQHTHSRHTGIAG